MSYEDMVALPIHQVIPTLRKRLAEDIAILSQMISDEEFENSRTLLKRMKTQIDLLEVCIEETRSEDVL